MATFSWSCTSTAANEVAGCTGGGLWSLARAAGKAVRSASSEATLRDVIVHDCIILGLDRKRANSVTHDCFFLQPRAVVGAACQRALVVVANCDHEQIPRGPWRAIGQCAGLDQEQGGRAPGDLATRGFGWRGAGGEPAG